MDFSYQRTVITRPDGGVSIMSIVISGPIQAFGKSDALAKGFQPSQDETRWEGGITDDGIADEIKRSGVEAVSWRRIAETDIPADRTFRDAWIDDGKILSHDLDKARMILRDRIRAARDFSALDVAASQFQTKAALGTLTADDKAALADTEAQRQKLRDAPADPAIDAAQDIDALKALLP